MKTLAHLVSAALLLIGSCGAAAQPSTAAAQSDSLCTLGVAALRESLKVEPKVLAARSAAGGDYRYLEWHGFTSAIPGVANQQCVRDAKFHKWFEGTSDALCSREHRTLYERSHAFAEQYNRHMVGLRTAKGLQSCNVR